MSRSPANHPWAPGQCALLFTYTAGMAVMPGKVFVFSGHMVDEGERATPRFPNDPLHIERARAAIATALGGAGTGDLALTQGACGGDLLFSAACVERGLVLRWQQPFAEADFMARSVARGGARWMAQYDTLRPHLEQAPRALAEVLGPPLADDLHTPYWRCNRWLLDTALSYGVAKLHFICLWDGGAPDSDGGTAQMLEEVRCYTTSITVIETRTL